MKKMIVLIAAAALMFAVAGCGKKDEGAKAPAPIRESLHTVRREHSRRRDIGDLLLREGTTPL